MQKGTWEEALTRIVEAERAVSSVCREVGKKPDLQGKSDCLPHLGKRLSKTVVLDERHFLISWSQK